MTSSFTPSTVAALATALPAVPAGLLHLRTLDTATSRRVALDYGATVLCPQVGASGLDAPGVSDCHDAGLALLVWTVDDLDEGQALAAAGVDAICTNEPAAFARRLVRSVAEASG